MERAMDAHASMPAYLRALGWVRELLALVDEYAREGGGCDDGSERSGDDRPSTWWLQSHPEAVVELDLAGTAERARALRAMTAVMNDPTNPYRGGGTSNPLDALSSSRGNDDDFEVAPV